MGLDKENYKRIVKSIAGGDDIIPGIHNYCDRWCERCTHSGKCSVFKIEKEMNLSNEDMDIQNEQFWKSLKELFWATSELLDEKMKELDIDTDDKPTENFITEPLNNEMVIVSKEYAFEVAKWLEKHRNLIIDKFELNQNVNESKALIIADAIDIIQHYFMMVATKTYRASLVYKDNEEQNEDARGSAKVALIIIDRSIAAWSALLKDFSDFEDDILKFLKDISKVKRLLLNAFPNAMEFIRPGFDE